MDVYGGVIMVMAWCRVGYCAGVFEKINVTANAEKMDMRP